MQMIQTEANPGLVNLSLPQLRFTSTSAKFPAFVGGFGSGKTFAGIARAMACKFEEPEGNVGYYLPTFDLVRRIGFPRFEEYLSDRLIPYRTNTTDATIDIGPKGDWGQIIFRTMDKPERIVGYEVTDSVADELDTLPIDKAKLTWEKIIARNRQKKRHSKKVNTAAVVTTPEGFRFVYTKWQEDVKPGYELIRSPTSANWKHIPEDYIQSLRDSYSEQLLAAYLEGLFVNLTSGSVYPNFDRFKNASSETVISNANLKEAVHVGLDFNVTKMAAAIHVLRDDIPHCVGELTNVFDTPAMIKLLKDRYKDRGHTVFIYPDASGNARDSNNASESDLTLLRQAGFTVCVNSRNPRVRDRILSVNTKICKNGDARTYFVNPQLAPSVVQGLEKQSYDKNGEPDKTAGLDHILDGLGYFINYKYPVLKRVASAVELRV